MKTPNSVSIAIIGGGAAGTAVAHFLVKSLGVSSTKVDVNICVYEKNGTIGPGLAYKRDNDVLLMNMVSRDASLFPGEPESFWRWLARTLPEQYTKYALAGSAMSPDSFVPRALFGCYLSQMFEQVISDAELSGINLDKRYAEVISLQKTDSCFELVSATGEMASFDYVVLCTGNTKPVDLYGLSGHSRYINEPYPLQSYLSHISPHDRVAILGTQLTAADIAIALAHNGHKGSIEMVSRSKELPSMRSVLEAHQLQYITLSKLNELTSNGNASIRLRQALRLLRKEFALVGADWREVLFRSSKHLEPRQYFERGLLNSTKTQAWQWVMVAVDHVIEFYWNALIENDKSLFMSDYHRNWNSKRAPLPVTTAFKIHALLATGQLKVMPGIKNINITDHGTFHAGFVQDAENLQASEYDWVINATGPSRHIDKNLELSVATDLLDAGSAVKHQHGGIRVEFASSAVINEAGLPDYQLYALGQLTCGTHYFVSSVEMISLRARVIADKVTQDIIQRKVNTNRSTMMAHEISAEIGADNVGAAYGA